MSCVSGFCALVRGAPGLDFGGVIVVASLADGLLSGAPHSSLTEPPRRDPGPPPALQVPDDLQGHRGAHGAHDTRLKCGREQRLPHSVCRSHVPAQGRPPPRALICPLTVHTHAHSLTLGRPLPLSLAAASCEATVRAGVAMPPRRAHAARSRWLSVHRHLTGRASCSTPGRVSRSATHATRLPARCVAAFRLVGKQTCLRSLPPPPHMHYIYMYVCNMCM